VLTGRRKIYYGWWVAIGSVASMALLSGVSFWSFGLYVEPLEEEFGWSRAQVSFGFSSSILVSGLIGPFVGRWVDARGPRSSIILGAVLTALTYLLLATTSALWQWYLFQSINAVCRQLMFIIPFQALISRWFDRKRGIALAMLGSGFSLGGFAVVPLMNMTIDWVQWQGSFVVAGAATAIVTLPISILLLRNSPEDVGALVDGDRHVEGQSRSPAQVVGVTLGQAIRTPLFWTLAAALTLFFYGMFGWLVHQVPFYESVGISRQAAANIVAVAAFLSIVMRITIGLFADRFARFEVVAMALAGFLFCAMTTLLVNPSPAGIALFVMLWVIGAGAGPMMEALLLTRSFGLRHFGAIFGVVMVVETTGQILSPTVAGAIYDSTGSYDWALIMYMCTFASALLLFAIAWRMPRPIDSLQRNVSSAHPRY
jgi:sugar phosphate permease